MAPENDFYMAKCNPRFLHSNIVIERANYNYVKFSLYAVASAVNLNCNQQNYVCDGEEVVCNCTAPCREPIHWWDNQTISFCSRTQLCNGNRQNCEPDISPPVHVKIIDCLSRSDTFTSCLSYNASLEMGSNSRTIQIGCSSAMIGSTCSPEGEPSDAESVSLLVINCTGNILVVKVSVYSTTVLCYDVGCPHSK